MFRGKKNTIRNNAKQSTFSRSNCFSHGEREREREGAGRKKGRGERERESIKRLVLFLRTTFGCTDGPRTNKVFLNFDGVPLLRMSYICLGVLKFSIHAENEKWFPRFDPRLSDN